MADPTPVAQVRSLLSKPYLDTNYLSISVKCAQTFLIDGTIRDFAKVYIINRHMAQTLIKC